ncbi:MAG: hypothetical protein ACFFAN_13745, partial [Promethearchaeota archaeon]
MLYNNGILLRRMNFDFIVNIIIEISIIILLFLCLGIFFFRTIKRKQLLPSYIILAIITATIAQ